MRIDDNGSTVGGQSAGSVAAAWAAFASALAAHFFALQNRTDVHGRYKPPWMRTPDPKTGKVRSAYTAHAVLTDAILVGHFTGLCRGDLVGLHVSSPAETCKFAFIDFDAHGDGDDPEANWKMALAVYFAARGLGFDVLLLDSNGKGGFHLWIVFARPIPMADAWRLGKWLVRDFASFGLPKAPETFPKSRRLSGMRIGNLARLPGRHHTLDHWTRVWGGERWLEGEAAIAAILAVVGKDIDLAAVIPPDFEPRPRQSTGRRPSVVTDLASNPASMRSDIAMGLAPEPSERRIATVREALGYLGAEYRGDYDRWIKVGLMLGELGEPGLALWHEWAQSCPNYRAGALDEAWEGFAAGAEGPGEGRITLGSLFYLARQAGWPGPPRRVRGVTRHRGTFTIRASRHLDDNIKE